MFIGHYGALTTNYLSPTLVALFIIVSNIMVAQTITLDIDWNNPVKTIQDNAYGVNSPANFIPSHSNDGVFMSNLSQITQKKGLIRLHGWGMIDENSPESWLTDGQWDSLKIHQALMPLVQQGYEVMINIPSGPLGENDYQNPQQFAQFCADLVQIVNIDYQLNVAYWEIPNERESSFTTPGLTVNEMSNFIQIASQAMKNIDPTIKVGGAATAWVNIAYLTQLVQLTPEMDFISCHTYAGDCSNSLQDIYDNAQNAILDLSVLRQNIDGITGSSYLPIFLTEYNLSYQGCSAILEYKGAVYDAMMLTQSIKSGVDATCYWNVAPYSDMSMVVGDNLTENAYLFEIMNKYFHGEMVQASTSDSTKILIFATKKTSTNYYSFCLINRTNFVQNIALQMNGIVPDSLHRYLWDTEYSYLVETKNWTELNNGNFALSPYSVTIFHGQNHPLGIESIENKDCLLAPNPTMGKLHLVNNHERYDFQILSIIGQLLETGKVENDEIDITKYSSGIYFVRLFNKDRYSKELKVIKK